MEGRNKVRSGVAWNVTYGGMDFIPEHVGAVVAGSYFSALSDTL